MAMESGFSVVRVSNSNQFHGIRRKFKAMESQSIVVGGGTKTKEILLFNVDVFFLLETAFEGS